MTVFPSWLDSRIARFAAITATEILSAILTLGILGWASTAHAVIPVSQRTVLTDLYTSTNGAAWTNKTNWNGAVGTECTWFGVTCDGTQSNVLVIELPNNSLVGTLPALSGLPALRNFTVRTNQLTGPVPSPSGLTALRIFSVGGNQLTNNWCLTLMAANGQSMTGPYKAPIIINSNVGPVTIVFQDAANALLTLPTGRQVAIARHRF